MRTDRRKQLLLVALLAVLAVVLYRAFATQAPSRTASTTSKDSRAAGQAARGGAAGVKAPDVHLDALNGERPAPGEAERNLFRFKPKAPPPPPPSAARPSPNAAPPVRTAPSGPPPPPPITLKFIGIVEAPGRPKFAVLSDGQGPPMTVPEGGVAAGRYRVLRIGVESVELAYLDGRGRQTIRLTGGS